MLVKFFSHNKPINLYIREKMKKKDIKILLVDDEPDVIEIIKYNLEQDGYNVKTASNGKEALIKAKKIPLI